ncbi:MAG TPA: MaoC family dehydratase [Spongiibacteraceae bacterium]|jgi:hypothetical protein|nr:MaoC family dehydratase [Spongiibacteraceae bacterium]
MAENAIQIAADVPDVVKSWAGRPVIVERSEIAVERGAWENFCAAVEDGNPLYWDEAVATGISNGLISPPALLSSWTRPHPWSPHHQQQKPRPLELHFMLKDALQLPLGIVRETELVFLEPLRVGDRVVGEQYLREVSEELTTHLGTGRNWMIEVIYQRDDGVEVGIERIRCFGYRKAHIDQ